MKLRELVNSAFGIFDPRGTLHFDSEDKPNY